MKSKSARNTAAASKAKTRIALIDDHPIVRAKLVQRLNGEPDMMVCAETKSARSSLALVDSVKPDLVLLDIAIGSSGGLDLIKEFTAQFPALPVLVLTVYNESLYAERAVRAGARGYVMKTETFSVLAKAIRQVLSGKIHLSDCVTAKVFGRMAGEKADGPVTLLELLSDRELQVFHLIGQKFDTMQIASQLHLSRKTIASHRDSIRQKLKLKSADALVRFALPWVGDRIERA